MNYKFHLISFFIFLILLTSCSNSIFKNKKSSICVNLPAQPSRAAYTQGDIDYYEVFLLKGSAEELQIKKTLGIIEPDSEEEIDSISKKIEEAIISDKNYKPGNAIIFDEMEPADYTVVVIAFQNKVSDYDKDGITYSIKIGEGYASGTLNAGETLELEIKMKLISEDYTPVYQTTVTSSGELINALSKSSIQNIIVSGNIFLIEDLEITVDRDISIKGAYSASGFTGSGENTRHIVATGDDSHTLTLRNLFFNDGYAGESQTGGAISATNLSEFNIYNCSFANNYVYHTREDNGGQGGAIYINNCTGVTINECSFLYELENGSGMDYNSACSAGGFIYIDTETTNVSILYSTFTGAFGNHGGARVTSLIDGCTFNNNQGHYRGGGINAGSNAVITVQNCIFDTNYCAEGSGFYSDIYTCDATVTVRNCTFTDDKNYSCRGEGSGGVTFQD